LKQKLITEDAYRDKLYVFEDRTDAGRELAHTLRGYKNTGTLVLAIPSGGIPVAAEIASYLNLQLDLLIVRKVQIPWNTEAGFGAVDPDGEVIFNNALLMSLNLTKEEINVQVQKTIDSLGKRDRLFRKNIPFPSIKDKEVIIVDDGLASGYTMLSALMFIRRREPQKIAVAVPTGSQRTVDRILKNVDQLVCLNIRTGFPFAVAEAFKNWFDLTDNDVRGILDIS
jgi:predicted phosphoribosyltransferase